MVTVGRSMSGKFWIFIALKPSSPAKVSMMKSRIAGVGLRMDQEDTFSMSVSPGSRGGQLGRGGRGRGSRHHAHGVAVGQKAGAGCHHLGRSVEAAGDLDALADAAPDVHLDLRDL